MSCLEKRRGARMVSGDEGIGYGCGVEVEECAEGVRGLRQGVEGRG